MEEAKLIFELVNRSGVQGGGGTAAPAGQQSRAPSGADQFRESLAGGAKGSLSDNNPQQRGQPAASVPPSPAAPVSQPIVTPVAQQPAGPVAPGTQAPRTTEQPGQSSAAQDAARQVKEALKTAQSVASSIPGVGSQVSGLLNKGAGIADTVAKLQPLFAPKIFDATLAAPGKVDARQAEKDALGGSLQMPASKSPGGPSYPSSRDAAQFKERENARSIQEFDEALRREQESRRPIGMDDGPALPVPPSAAAPASPKATQHLPSPAGTSQAFQAAQLTGAAAPAAAGPATAAGGALGSLGPLAAAAAPIALPIAASAALVFAEYKALEFANNTARRIAGEAEQQIAGLSPEVAMAQAQEQMNQLQANFRTSDRLGDEVAGFIENRSAIANELQDMRDKIGEPLLRLLNTQQDALGKLLGVFNDSTALAGAVKALTWISGGVERIEKLATRWLPELKKEPEGGNLFMWYDQQPPLKLPAPFGGNDEFVKDGQIDLPGLEIN